MIECDVLVIGGGPAGVSVSDAAADKGLDVICVEKKQKIGIPVHCAEGVGEYLLEKLPFRFPKKLLDWKIEGLSFTVDNDDQIVKKGEIWGGYSINRDVVEPWLASRAVKKGAKILTNTKFLKTERDGRKYVSTLHDGNERIKIASSILIGADGVVSSLATSLGLIPSNQSVGYVYSWEVENIYLEQPEFEYLFLGEFSPNGYGYIFPKSKNRANIGVGDLFSKKGIETKFKQFINHKFVKSCLKDCRYVVEKSKQAPFETLHPISKENVFFVGDSANQNIKPFVEGFLPAIICGNLLGKNLPDIDIDLYNQLIEDNLPELCESQMLIDPMIQTFKRHDSKRFHDLLHLFLTPGE